MVLLPIVSFANQHLDNKVTENDSRTCSAYITSTADAQARKVQDVGGLYTTKTR